MLTPEQMASSPVGRHVLREIANYVVQVMSMPKDDVSLWGWMNFAFADLLDSVPDALAGLDEGDLMGIVYEAGEWVSEDAYRPLTPIWAPVDEKAVSSQGVTVEAYHYGWPDPWPTHVKLAEEVLRHPASQWWSSPWKARQQVWAGKGKIEDAKSRSISDFRQGKPKAIFYTSSAVKGLCSSFEAQAISAEVDYRHFAPDFHYHALILEPKRPVLEIDSLDDWVELCESAPAKTRSGVVHPDWRSVADDWSAVHLTTSGLIACQGVPVETEAGTALLHGWDIECTAWLEYAVAGWDKLSKNMEDMRYWPKTVGRRPEGPIGYRDRKAIDDARFRRTLPPKYRLR